MKFPHFPKLLLPLLSLLIAFSALAQTAPDNRVLAQQFLNHLSKGETTKASKYFSQNLKDKASPEGLEKVWKGLQERVGEFQGVEAISSEQVAVGEVVLQTCVFEHARLDLKLTFDSTHHIIGIFFVPPKPAAAYKRPAYADSTRYTEREITVNAGGKFPLKGTLTLPADKGKARTKVPVLVLVHGSGPQDQDLTIGPNKLFRDLAHGLAQQGIATLRYDKRTYGYSSQMSLMKEPTVQEEVIDDAVAAVALAAAQPETNPKKVFLLGHSLGGMLAPRIAQAAPSLAGLILVAANARPMEDLVLEQYEYLYNLSEKNAQQRQLMDQFKEQAARVKSLDLKPTTPADSLPLGLPASYWLDLRAYNPVYTARSLPQRILVLHAERDYQVTRQDLSLWMQGLNGRPYRPISYPDLNHLLQEGKGPSTPSEYEKQSNVPEYVIKDIAKWVKGKL